MNRGRPLRRTPIARSSWRPKQRKPLPARSAKRDAIAEERRERTRIGPARLYPALERLTDRGIVRRTEQSDTRRAFYEATQSDDAATGNPIEADTSTYECECVCHGNGGNSRVLCACCTFPSDTDEQEA